MKPPAHNNPEGFWSQSVLILLCGGSGSRMQGAVTDKVLLPLAGKPVFLHSLLAWQKTAGAAPVVMVYRDELQKQQILDHIQTSPIDPAILYWAPGGNSRQESVRSGLRHLPEERRYLFIHDAARPLLQPSTLERIARLLPESGAVTAARPATDTMHYAASAVGHDPENTAISWSMLDRSRLWQMETPQAFRRDLLEKAHQHVAQYSLETTDDVSALIHIGQPVTPLIPDHPNVKLTRPPDIALIEYFMSASSSSVPDFRVGQGFDIHQFAPGRKLILGGVEIPHTHGLSGHSDADCLCHALADAILGACGLPDIGHFFPNNDPSIKDINSLLIVERAVKEASDRGWQIVNCDIALLAEQPKIGPHLQAMKDTLARHTGITTDRIGIKATTLEQIGGLGRGEGIACMATVLLRK